MRKLLLAVCIAAATSAQAGENPRFVLLDMFHQVGETDIRVNTWYDNLTDQVCNSYRVSKETLVVQCTPVDNSYGDKWWKRKADEFDKKGE